MEETQQYSPWQKKKVLTYIVSAKDRANNLALQEIIDRAPPYSRLCLLSGQYLEAVAIQRPIEIVADEGEDVRIVGRGPCITIFGNAECYISNIKFKSRTLMQNVAKEPPAVLCSSGQPIFFRCEMSSLLVGGSATPVVENCLIMGNTNGSGLKIADDAGGTYLRNVIHGHSAYCIEVSSRGVPSFVDNDIKANHMDKEVPAGEGLVRVAGATITDDTTAMEVCPSFVNNRFDDALGDIASIQSILAQQQASRGGLLAPASPSQPSLGPSAAAAGGLLAAGNAVGGLAPLSPRSMAASAAAGRKEPAVPRTRKRSSIVGGIPTAAPLGPSVAAPSLPGPSTSVGGSGGKQTLSATDIAHKRTAVVVSGSAAPTFQGNVFQGSLVGLCLQGCGGTYAANTFSSSVLVALLLLRGASPTVKENKIGNQLGGGIFADCCNPHILNNSITDCRGAGLTVRECRGFTIESNAIEVCRGGIAVSGNSAGTFANNRVQNNAEFGVRIRDPGCEVKLKDNNLLANGAVGIVCRGGCCPKLIRNVISGHQHGMTVEECASPYLHGNTLQGNDFTALWVQENGRGEYQENKFSGGKTACIQISAGGTGLFTANEIIEGSIGVLVTEGGIGTFHANDIRGHNDGICVQLFADPYFYENNVVSCMRYGVVVQDEGIGTFVNNRFTNNHYGVACASGGEPVFRDNTFNASIQSSVLCGDGNRALFEKNNFASSQGTHITLSGTDSAATVLRNRIEGAAAYGIVSEKGAQGVVRWNYFSANRDGGYGTRDGGNTAFLNNTSAEERGPGIVVLRDGKGTFADNCVTGGRASGCVLEGGSSASIRNCTFERCGGNGVDVRNGALGTIEDSQCRGNAGAGMSFVGACRTVVRRMVVEENSEGVVVGQEAVCVIRDSVVRKQPVGIRFSSSGAALVEKCDIRENDVGVRGTSGGSGQLVDCVFTSNTVCHFELCEGGTVTASQCKFLAGKAAVVSRTKARGLVKDSTIDACEAGVFFENNGDTTVQAVAIAGCQRGVLVGVDGAGIVRGCNIRYNQENVVVQRGGRCLFDGNTISDALSGDAVVIFGVPKLLGNKITNNRRDGVRISAGASPLLQLNTIATNAANGIYCAERSDGVLLENTIDQNGEAGVRLESGSSCAFTENKIRANKVYGVRCAVGAAGQFNKNEIHANDEANVMISQNCSTTFDSNSITEGNPTGVVVEGGSCARLMGNTIKGHLANGVLITGRSMTSFESNMISGNSVGALFVAGPTSPSMLSRAGSGSFEGPADLSATARGVAALSGSRSFDAPAAASNPEKADARRGSLSQPQAGGRRLTGGSQSNNSSSAVFKANQFFCNKVCAVQLEAKSQAVLKANTIREEEIGVWAASESGGTVEENRFVNNKVGVSVFGDSHTTKVCGNVFEQNKTGLLLKTTTTLHARSNVFRRNKSSGICATGECAARVTHNSFEGDAVGIFCENGARPDCSQNFFTQCAIGVHLTKTTEAKLHRNQFSEHCEMGLYADGGGGEVRYNVFSLCSVAGVCVERDAAQSVALNLFCQNTESELSCGVLVRYGGKSVFNENDFHENSCGVRAESNGTSEFNGNLFHDNQFYGVQCTSGARPVINRCFFTRNASADVVSTSGALPVVQRCLFRESCTHLRVTDGGGGDFNNNVLRGATNAAVHVVVPPLAWPDEADDDGDGDGASWGPRDSVGGGARSVSPPGGGGGPPPAATVTVNRSFTFCSSGDGEGGGTAGGGGGDAGRASSRAVSVMSTDGAGLGGSGDGSSHPRRSIAVQEGNNKKKNSSSQRHRRVSSVFASPPAASPVFSSNLFLCCATGVDVECLPSEQQQQQQTAALAAAQGGSGGAGGKKRMSLLLSPVGSSGALGSTTSLQRKGTLSRLVPPALAAAAAADLSGNGGIVSPTRRANDASLVCLLHPIGDRVELERSADSSNGRGVALFTKNVFQSCEQGVHCHGAGFLPPAAATRDLDRQRHCKAEENLRNRALKGDSSAVFAPPAVVAGLGRHVASSPTSRPVSPPPPPEGSNNKSRSSFLTVLDGVTSAVPPRPPDWVEEYPGDLTMNAAFSSLVVFDGNTFSCNDWGVVVRQAAQARFVNNFVHKSPKGGVLVTDEGRGQFFQNIIADCGPVGVTIQGEKPCYCNFEENWMSGSRTNLNVACGDGRYAKNMVFNGDIGVVLAKDTGGLFEGNTVYANARTGCLVFSETFQILANNFYSANDGGAYDNRAETGRLPAGNNVRNQINPRFARPDIAPKVQLSAETTEARATKDEAALHKILKAMHDEGLPECRFRGCKLVCVDDDAALLKPLRPLPATFVTGRLTAQRPVMSSLDESLLLGSSGAANPSPMPPAGGKAAAAVRRSLQRRKTRGLSESVEGKQQPSEDSLPTSPTTGAAAAKAGRLQRGSKLSPATGVPPSATKRPSKGTSSSLNTTGAEAPVSPFAATTVGEGDAAQQPEPLLVAIVAPLPEAPCDAKTTEEMGTPASPASTNDGRKGGKRQRGFGSNSDDDDLGEAPEPVSDASLFCGPGDAGGGGRSAEATPHDGGDIAASIQAALAAEELAQKAFVSTLAPAAAAARRPSSRANLVDGGNHHTLTVATYGAATESGDGGGGASSRPSPPGTSSSAGRRGCGTASSSPAVFHIPQVTLSLEAGFCVAGARDAASPGEASWASHFLLPQAKAGSGASDGSGSVAVQAQLPQLRRAAPPSGTQQSPSVGRRVPVNVILDAIHSTTQLSLRHRLSLGLVEAVTGHAVALPAGGAVDEPGGRAAPAAPQDRKGPAVSPPMATAAATTTSLGSGRDGGGGGLAGSVSPTSPTIVVLAMAAEPPKPNMATDVVVAMPTSPRTDGPKPITEGGNKEPEEQPSRHVGRSRQASHEGHTSDGHHALRAAVDLSAVPLSGTSQKPFSARFDSYVAHLLVMKEKEMNRRKKKKALLEGPAWGQCEGSPTGDKEASGKEAVAEQRSLAMYGSRHLLAAGVRTLPSLGSICSAVPVAELGAVAPAAALSPGGGPSAGAAAAGSPQPSVVLAQRVLSSSNVDTAIGVGAATAGVALVAPRSQSFVFGSTLPAANAIGSLLVPRLPLDDVAALAASVELRKRFSLEMTWALRDSPARRRRPTGADEEALRRAAVNHNHDDEEEERRRPSSKNRWGAGLVTRPPPSSSRAMVVAQQPRPPGTAPSRSPAAPPLTVRDGHAPHKPPPPLQPPQRRLPCPYLTPRYKRADDQRDAPLGRFRRSGATDRFVPWSKLPQV